MGVADTGTAGAAARDVSTVVAWFAANARDLPWRHPGTTPWGVLVSEVMSQQTPVARVAPRWTEWMGRWPAPADVARASTADVLRVWDRLGYPRRALRLKECAQVVLAEHGGELPAEAEALRALPGVGDYTAAAVVAFAHGRRSVVLDTNVRRVLGRVWAGTALPAPHLGRAERDRAAALLPTDAATSARWNAGLMELGALVCTARSPRCAECPLAGRCAWRAAGRPADTHAGRRRAQPWQGTDRQARGRIMAHLRQDHGPVSAARLHAAAGGADGAQPARALASLVADGLVAEVPGGYALP